CSEHGKQQRDHVAKTSVRTDRWVHLAPEDWRAWNSRFLVSVDRGCIIARFEDRQNYRLGKVGIERFRHERATRTGVDPMEELRRTDDIGIRIQAAYKIHGQASRDH